MSTFTKRAIRGTLQELKMAYSRAWGLENSELVDVNRVMDPRWSRVLRRTLDAMLIT